MNLQITNAASSLHDAHARCLQSLILAAHDLACDVVVTPKRIQYANIVVHVDTQHVHIVH